MLENVEVTRKEFVGDVEVLTPRTISDRMSDVNDGSVRQWLATRPDAPAPYAISPRKDKVRTLYRAEDLIAFVIKCNNERYDEIATLKAMGKNRRGRPVGWRKAE